MINIEINTIDRCDPSCYIVIRSNKHRNKQNPLWINYMCFVGWLGWEEPCETSHFWMEQWGTRHHGIPSPEPLKHLACVSGVFIHRDGLGMREHGEFGIPKLPTANTRQRDSWLSPRSVAVYPVMLTFRSNGGTAQLRPRIKHWLILNVGVVQGNIWDI